ncbi:DUF4956 domain-containing protein [Flexivirga sp. B27]
MTLLVAVAADLVAIAVLAFGVYYRRHFRRDLVLSYVALNVGIMAVAGLLSGGGAGVGLGMGLFGILSIIRLRSDAITQEEVAYYFVALAMGLVNGLHPEPIWVAPAISAGLVAILFLADHPRFAHRTRRQLITLDRAYPQEPELRAALERTLGAEVLHMAVAELDLVRDLTVVDVRFRIGMHSAATSADGELTQSFAQQVR